MISPLGRSRISALATAFLLTAAAARSADRPFTVPDFARELQQLEAAVEQSDASRRSQLADNLPDTWEVVNGDQSFTVQSNGIRVALRRQSDPGAQVRAVEQIAALRQHLEDFQRPPADAAPPRALLNDILSQPEFRDLHGPTLLQRALARVNAWLADLFGRLLGTSVIPTLSAIVIYALAAAAVLAFGWWTFRALRAASSDLERVVPGGPPTVAREWTAWLDDAEAAGQAGAWREAVHAAYWCAVSFLEARGAWRVDRARTPREYSALLPAANPAKAALTSMTREFERTWYGVDPADADTVARVREHLRSIGCPPA